MIEDERFNILKAIYQENPEISPPKRPERLPFKSESRMGAVLRTLIYEGFVVRDGKTGKLAITDDGEELLKSMLRQNNRAKESPGADQTPADHKP
jgi:hypothetical protein